MMFSVLLSVKAANYQRLPKFICFKIIGYIPHEKYKYSIDATGQKFSYRLCYKIMTKGSPELFRKITSRIISLKWVKGLLGYAIRLSLLEPLDLLLPRGDFSAYCFLTACELNKIQVVEYLTNRGVVLPRMGFRIAMDNRNSELLQHLSTIFSSEFKQCVKDLIYKREYVDLNILDMAGCLNLNEWLEYSCRDLNRDAFRYFLDKGATNWDIAIHLIHHPVAGGWISQEQFMKYNK